MIQTTITPPAPTATAAMPLGNILDLNNHAVSYLCQGNHSATTATLRSAIQSLEQCFQQDNANDNANNKDTAHQPACCSWTEPPTKKRRRSMTTSTASSSTATTPSTSDITKEGEFVAIRSITVSDASSSSACDNLPPSCCSINDDTSLLMVYDRAFNFPSVTRTDFGSFSQQSKTRLAAILLYNLGLSYHREGARSGLSADLTMALKLYREAYMVLKSAWGTKAGGDFEQVFVLLIALLNNMACIHCNGRNDNRDTHQCINWMNRAIASRQRSILSKEDYTFFSLNLSVFRGHGLKLASAA